MTVRTSNSNITIGGHQSEPGYCFNRNVPFAANGWFDNQNDIAKPVLSLNHLGGCSAVR